MIELEGWDPVSRKVVRKQLPLKDREALRTRFLPPERCLHAAVGVHMDTGRRLVLGVAAERWEEFLLTVEQIDGKFHFDAEGSEVFYLPYQGGYRIHHPIQTGAGAGKIDIALLVDGTMRLAPRRFLFDRTSRATTTSARVPSVSDEASPTVAKASPETARAAVFAPILEALSRCAAAPNGDDVYACVCSFADLKTNGLLEASDLQPDYVTSPESPRLQKLASATTLQRMLDDVRPSTGADFVDALSEGLEACGTIRWRSDSRRIVILVGDSPGFSFRFPIEGQMDLHARALDVQLEAERLAAKGVEIVTVFSGLGQIPGSIPKTLIQPIRAARDQYRALASSDDHVFTVDWDMSQTPPVPCWDASDPLMAILNHERTAKWLGRGVCWAIFSDNAGS